MSRRVADYIIRGFQQSSSVNSELLLTAFFYLEKRAGLPAVGAHESLLKLLENETFDDDTAQTIKVHLVDFATMTTDPRLHVAAIRTLQVFQDPKLNAVMTTWLDRHLRELLHHSAAVNQLLFALKAGGADIKFGRGHGITDVELNIEVARRYLRTELGLEYPW